MNREPGHVPEAYIELEVRDKEGKIINYHKQEAKTWVRNFFKMIRDTFNNTSLGIVKQDGTSLSLSGGYTVVDVYRVVASSGDSNYGILVGSGTKGWDINDYKLDSKIAHGSGTNQLMYGATTVEDIVIGSNNISFRIIRTFTNSSGSSITVTEVGLATYGYGTYPLIARDVLSTPVSVPPGSTLTVRYIVSMSW